MEKYSKINSIFKRDMGKPRTPLIVGDWSEPEFEYLKDNQWIGTEKVDGTNTRVVFTLTGGISTPSVPTIKFFGKTDDAIMNDEIIAALAAAFPFDRLSEYFKLKPGADKLSVTFYGELYGPNIHGGGKYSDEIKFILFDVKIDSWWLLRNAVEQIALDLSIPIVPIVFTGTLLEAIDTIIHGYYSLISTKPIKAEGMVLIPKAQLFNRKRNRIITKLKERDFEK